MFSSMRKYISYTIPDIKVYGAYMGPTWGRQDPGGPHVGPMNLAFWDVFKVSAYMLEQSTYVMPSLIG